MTEVTTDRRSTSGLPAGVAWGVGLFSMASGLWLLSRLDRTGITGGVLLLTVGFAFLAVAVGGRPYGPAVEGRLDLSARLALGLMGGLLGGLAYAVAEWLLFAVGVTGLFDVTLGGGLSFTQWISRSVHGAVWGVALGLFLPLTPGEGPMRKAALFSLVPALYVLLKVYPVDVGAGFLGHELGVFTPLFILVLHLVWGLTCGAALRWGERTAEAPVSRPLVE